MEKKITDTAKKTGWELKIPFGLKLTLIVTLILLASIWIITSLMAATVNAEFIRTADETNLAINNRAAAGMEDRLYRIRSEALSFLEMSQTAGNSGDTLRQLRNVFFERNPYIGALILPGVEEIFNGPFFSYNEIPREAVNAWLVNESETLERAKAGEPVLRNVTPALGINLLALFYPWQNSGFNEAAVIFFSPQSLAEISSGGFNTTVVVNDRGDILLSPDFDRVRNGENISAHALFEALWKDSGESVRINYTEGGKRYIGAGHRISLANAAVFTSLEYSIVTGQISAVTRRNIQLSVTVMFLSILVTWFFSRIVSTPVKKLIAAAGRIEAGEFNLSDLKKKSRDELGTLTGRFISMGEGLSRWSDAKALVGRYNNEKALAGAVDGKIKLAGEYRAAVILSVDMVSFYSIFPDAEAKVSGNAESSGETGTIVPAAEALAHLNFLISKTAENVEKTGGVIDTVSGPALIALWGVPFLSGDIAGELMNCLRSVVALRTLLWEINTERETQGKPLYRIRCGVHSGEVLAGGVGSPRFRQYTVVGKAVDEAVKAGEVCEPAKTDIVITESARDLAGDRILAEKLKLTKQYKSDRPLFALVNLVPSREQEKQPWPFTLKDVQESLRGRQP